MQWLHRLQQRVSITRNEALTLISLSVFFMVGITGRHVCRQAPHVEPDAYAEIDSLFAVQSSSAADASQNESENENVNGSERQVNAFEKDVNDTPADSDSTAQNTDSSTDPPAAKPVDGMSVSEKIDLNRATAADLDQLPRIGPKMAQRILEFRRAFGPLRSVDELLSVRGIGQKTLEQIRPHAYVSTGGTAADQGSSEGAVPDQSVPDTIR